jgi:putative FmdB family regulatory protein
LPIYEYRCDDCGASVEAFQKMSDAPLETCEACGGHLSRVLHPVAIHFKGSGFYTTDYGRGSGRRPGAREPGAGDSSGAGEPSGSDDAGSSTSDAGAAKSTPAASPAGGKEKQKTT